MQNFNFKHELELGKGMSIKLDLNIVVFSNGIRVGASAVPANSEDDFKSVEEEIEGIEGLNDEDNDGFTSENPDKTSCDFQPEKLSKADVVKAAETETKIIPELEPGERPYSNRSNPAVKALFKKEGILHHKNVLAAIRLEQLHYERVDRLTKEQEFEICRDNIELWRQITLELPAWIKALGNFTSQASLTLFIFKNLQKNPKLVKCPATDSNFIAELCVVGKHVALRDENNKIRHPKTRVAYYRAFKEAMDRYAASHSLPPCEA